jgi:hypothetical protein
MGEKKKTPKIIKKLGAALKNSSVSKKNLEMLLNAIHLGLPWILLGLVLLGPRWLALLSLGFLGICLLSLMILGGSWLTMLTQEITEDDHNIIDPFVEILRMEPNESNRTKVYWMIGLWFIVVIGAIFYVRFISENNIVKKVLSDDLEVKDVVNMVRGAY